MTQDLANDAPRRSAGDVLRDVVEDRAQPQLDLPTVEWDRMALDFAERLKAAGITIPFEPPKK